jgi:hypothetical protein
MDRRVQMEDLDTQLERQCFNLNLERWMVIYRDRILGSVGLTDEDGGTPLGADDLDELDAYMESQERSFAAQQENRVQEILHGKHTMSGAQTGPTDWRTSRENPLQWGPWQ